MQPSKSNAFAGPHKASLCKESPLNVQKHRLFAILYGFSLIRRELRAIPKDFRFQNKNYRNIVLSYYDHATHGRSYLLDSKIDEIAHDYLRAYQGGISKTAVLNDFRIVACASLHDLSILVTEDRHSMASPPAQRAYTEVNGKRGLKNPQFYSIDAFKSLL